MPQNKKDHDRERRELSIAALAIARDLDELTEDNPIYYVKKSILDRFLLIVHAVGEAIT